MLRPRGQPCPPAVKPPNPFGLSPPFALLSGAAAAGGTCQRGHGGCGTSLDGPCEPLPTRWPLPLQLWGSVTAGGHCPQLACPASACQWTETAKRRTWLGARAAGPARFVTGTRPVSGAFGWTPTLHPPWGPQAAGMPHPWHRHHLRPGPGRAGGRMAAFALFPWPPSLAWCLPLAPWGAQGPALREQELWCFTHDCFLSPMGCHQRPPACPRQGAQPCWCVLPARAAASRGVRPLWPCPALAHVRWALGTIPGAWQRRPCRGARGGAEGYFTGYFTRWHQLFLPSAPNHVPPPRAHHPASCLP